MGGGLYLRSQRAHGNWFVDLLHGELQTGSNTEALFFGTLWEGDFRTSTASVGRIMFEPVGQRWRIGWTGVSAELPFQPGPSDPITPGTLDLQMHIGSLQYNLERWSFTTEYLRARTHWNNFGPIYENPDKQTLEAFYLQVDYRATPGWQLLVRYDDLVLAKADDKGKAFELKTGTPGHLRYSKDWTLGARYQSVRQWEIRGEWHNVDGTAWLSKQDNPDSLLLKKRWNLFLLQFAYRF